MPFLWKTEQGKRDPPRYERRISRPFGPQQHFPADPLIWKLISKSIASKFSTFKTWSTLHSATLQLSGLHKYRPEGPQGWHLLEKVASDKSLWKGSRRTFKDRSPLVSVEWFGILSVNFPCLPQTLLKTACTRASPKWACRNQVKKSLLFSTKQKATEGEKLGEPRTPWK